MKLKSIMISTLAAGTMVWAAEPGLSEAHKRLTAASTVSSEIMAAPDKGIPEGGSVGLQIGGGEVDAILMVMNEEGKNKLLKSEFTLGAEAGAMAGPVGRSTKAETDALMHAKILSYSRARGIFAGVALEGGTLRSDDDDNTTLYGRTITPEEIVNGKIGAPREAQGLITQLSKYSWREK